MTKIDKKSKLKRRDWMNISWHGLVSHMLFQSSTCEKNQRKNEKTRHWMTELHLYTGERLRYWWVKSGPAWQAWEEAHEEVWPCSWPCCEWGQGCALVQHLPYQVPQHALHMTWYKTCLSCHPHTRMHNLLCQLQTGFAEFFKFLFFSKSPGNDVMQM